MTDLAFKFHGKRALITGAGQGIGRAIAIALSAAGADTYALSKTQAHLDTLVSQYPSIKPVCVDLCDWAATQKAVENVGSVDLLVNNAGTGILQSFLDIDPTAFDQTFNVNVRAIIAVSQVVVRKMIEERRPGSIVNISSQASMRALREHTVYCASKGAVDQITRTMALELGPSQIRVNSVNPTVVMTELGRRAWSDPERSAAMISRIPLGKFADEIDVVNAVLFLLSDSAAMINGTFLTVDGGFTVG